MSNREIDRKIAELMGMRPFEYVLWNGDVDYRVQSPFSEVLTDPVPYFHSDWNAMHLLVEWLQGKGFDISVESVAQDWSAKVGAYRPSYAASAPLALCNAVLALPAELLGPKGSDSTEQAQAEEGSD